MGVFRLRLLVSLFALLTIRVSSTSTPSAEQNRGDRDFIKAESIQGCYESGALNWRPELKLDKDEIVFITPPERIELLAERGTKEGKRIATWCGQHPTLRQVFTAQPIGCRLDQIKLVVLTTGTSGVEMQFTVRGGDASWQSKNFLGLPQKAANRAGDRAQN